MIILIFFLSFVACNNTEKDSGTKDQTESGTKDQTESGTNPGIDCEQCLQDGMTWQPEVNECTTNCEILDISCYTTECPGECSESCGFCFTESECNDAGCQWQIENEAAWCTE